MIYNCVTFRNSIKGVDLEISATLEENLAVTNLLK